MAVDCNSPVLLREGLKKTLQGIRRYQVHEVFAKRLCFGEYHHLFPVLRRYPVKFHQYLRMGVETFEYILEKTESRLNKKWCNLHKQKILAEERLVLTLRFLASGSTYTHLSFSFRMGISTVSKIVGETMGIIWSVLYPIHMPMPSVEKLITIAEDFYKKWQFPNCIGSIDGRHVRIKKPARSGSLFYNYKRYHSVVLQAVVDASYRFTIIDVGGFGRQHDAGMFKASTLYKALTKNKKMKKKLHLPPESKLSDDEVILPHVFVADSAYPIMENLLKPYPGKKLKKSQRLFNKRLSRALVVVENAFGPVCQKWRILETVIEKPVKVVNKIIKCTCLLHNIIIDMEKSTKLDVLSNSVSKVKTFAPVTCKDRNFVVGLGKEVREEYRKYFLRMYNSM